MRKFLLLVKKEIKELLTAQVILPLVFTALLFLVIGNIMGKEQEKAKKPQEVAVVNEDGGMVSNVLVETLKQSSLNVELMSGDNALESSQKENKVSLIKIPAGYSESVLNSEPKKIEIHTFVRNFSMIGGQNYASVMAAVAKANEAISNSIISERASGLDPIQLKNPIQPDEFTVVGDKQANISPNAIMGFVTQQTTFIPIILFIVIVFSSQMIATAIATEKENKTLETLLTTPVNRKVIVVAKMVGAGFISLIASVFYMFGFKYYIGGLAGNVQATGDINNFIETLGLTFTPEGYILLGVSLFIGILIALSISLILGAFAEDVKSVAGLTSPIMVLVMIPYFLTMFLDINSLPSTLKYITYVIPFSHVFLAAPNLFLHNYAGVIWGILYQLIWLIIAILIAAKIFSTDLIVTMKLNFSKKK
ncbi:MAG: ABC transporter permease [Patescibacteria group bacterium]